MPEPSEVPNWTLTREGVRLGGLPYMVQEVSGLLDLPEVRNNDVELIQRDGLWAGEDYLGSRSITITIRCVGTSEDDLSNKVAILRRAFRSTRTEVPLYFAIPGIADGAPSKVMGRTRKFESVADLNYGRFNAAFDIQIDCTDPHIYPLAGFGVRRHIYRGKDYHEGGAECPFHFTSKGLWIRATEPGEDVTAQCHNGSEDTVPLTVAIEGPLDGPVFRNLTTDQFVSVPSLQLATGSTLNITPNATGDNWRITVSRPGDVSLIPESSWGDASSYFKLPPGLTELAIESANETVVEYETHAVVSWVPGVYV
ncbi:hypothetical protein OV320_7863 [Actinobacteria bacterium OV320]|nr:hypothetical protein OV320_7863 [Actinobacteria bacterium OV320]